jgi:uncharacterized membrane protein
MINLIIYDNLLKKLVNTTVFFSYTISVIIIFYSLLYDIYIYFKEIDNSMIAFVDAKICISQAISLSISFVLAVEILKIFYINTYKQLVIVFTLTILKLILNDHLIQSIKKLEILKKL